MERVFSEGERLPMHEFLARFQREFCKGVQPDFYQRRVKIVAETEDGIYLKISHDLNAVQSSRFKVQGGEGDVES